MSTVKALAGAGRSFFAVLKNFFLLFFARLSYKLIGVFLFIFLSLLVFAEGIFLEKTSVEAASFGLRLSPIEERFSVVSKELGFEEKEVPDNKLAVGERKVVQSGKKGLLKTKTRLLLFAGKAFTKDVVETKIIPPTDRVVAFGTKKIYQQGRVDDQNLHYWAKLTMFSTSYDSNCPGCNESTALGLKTGFGVVAVDPKVIPLGTKVFIPNYGFAVAGDTGGSIKGNKIDLGFDDVKKGWWSARYTDVYLLTEP
ncbi:MAG: 3D domain-containing protein [bacterium]|nr:3D domain-containing protein [bacterium]